MEISQINDFKGVRSKSLIWRGYERAASSDLLKAQEKHFKLSKNKGEFLDRDMGIAVIELSRNPVQGTRPIYFQDSKWEGVLAQSGEMVEVAGVEEVRGDFW